MDVWCISLYIARRRIDVESYKTKIAYSKMVKKWVLYDFDGFAIGGYSTPSKARKAKTLLVVIPDIRA